MALHHVNFQDMGFTASMAENHTEKLMENLKSGSPSLFKYYP